MDMNKWKIKSVGISLLGGHSGLDGPYELGIDSIRAVNEEDVTAPPGMSIVCVPWGWYSC
jgi:NADH dehydrogenase [ubiquinone] 1 alpha subcomplex assembly factor 1